MRRWRVLKQFYVRRTLRIFPLYYLVLGIALVAGGAEVRVQLPWLATYTYNFWVAAQLPGFVRHLDWLHVAELGEKQRAVLQEAAASRQ